MGCDIHFFIEKFVAGRWQKQNFKVSYYGRNYVLFGALAGVRGTLIVPPIPPRGFPIDASITLRKKFEQEGGDAHTPSYMSINELFSIKDIEIKEDLVMSLNDYRKYLKNPYEYYYFLFPEDCDKAKIISQEEANRRINLSVFDSDEIIFVVVNKITVNNFAGEFFKRVSVDLNKFKDKNKLRCVFWFNN